MGRIRTIKPEFFQSRSLAQCDIPARLTFAGLWTEADDHGRGRADPRLIKGAIWPLDDEITHQHVSAHIRMLNETGHIRLYEVDGEPYYEIISWDDHQAAAYRRGNAVYPPPEAGNELSHERVQESASRTQTSAGTRNGEQGTRNEETPSVAEPEVGDRQRRFSVLADVCGLDVSNLTRNERGRLNDAEQQLREVGAEPAEIKAKAAAYRERFSDAALTPQGLVNNWGILDVKQTRGSPRREQFCDECPGDRRHLPDCPRYEKVSV